MRRIQRLIASGTPFTNDGRSVHADAGRPARNGYSRPSRSRMAGMRRRTSAAYHSSLNEALNSIDQGIDLLGKIKGEVDSQLEANQRYWADMKGRVEDANNALQDVLECSGIGGEKQNYHVMVGECYVSSVIPAYATPEDVEFLESCYGKVSGSYRNMEIYTINDSFEGHRVVVHAWMDRRPPELVWPFASGRSSVDIPDDLGFIRHL